MFNIKSKAALAMAAVLALSPALTTPVMAENYTAIPGTTTTLEKALVVDSDAEIPAAEFEFTVSAGTAVEATANTVKVWAGVTPENVKVNGVAETGTVEFTAGEAKTAGAANDHYTNDATKSYAKKTISLDFSECDFPEPGVYRYIITETDPTSPIQALDAKTSTVDVYIEDVEAVAGSEAVAPTEWYVDGDETTPFASEDEALAAAENDASRVTNNGRDAVSATAGGLKVMGYVAYEGTITAAPKVEESATTIPSLDGTTPNGAEAGAKDNIFRNGLDTSNIEFGKEVTGNQGSKDQYFEFKVVLDNLGAGTVITVVPSDNEFTAPHENEATSFAVGAMTTANTRDDDSAKTGKQLIANDAGKIEWTFYLHDGQYLEFKGLPKDATYAFTETAAAGYTKTDGIEADNAKDNEAHEDAVSGTIATDDVATGFTNNREGVLPTGLAVAVGGSALLVGLGLAGSAALKAKRKREDEE